MQICNLVGVLSRGVSLFGLVVFFVFIQGANARTPEDQSAPASLDLPEVIHRYFQSHGGRHYVEAINSIQLEGVFEVGANRLPILLIKKRPNLIYIRLTLQGYSLITSYDGETVYRIAENNMGFHQQLPLSEQEKASFLRDSSFQSVLVRNSKDYSRLSFKGETQHDGKTCYVIQVTEGEEVYTVYLDVETFREVSIEMESGGTTSTTRYSDYQQVGQLWVPHTVIQGSGESLQKLEVSTARLNVGVYDSFFRLER